MPSFRAVSEGPTVKDLREALDDVASFMDARSLPHAGDVRKALAEVTAGDAHGARRYLRLNRALADIYFHPGNLNARNEQEAEALQRRWEQLHGRAYSIADTLIRAR
jgi:hypothetical protein